MEMAKKRRFPNMPITCKCGKYWGKKKQGKFCNRCKTEVIARGEKNEDNR